MSDVPVDLSLIARQQGQILDELRSLRDDVSVLTAIAMRQDGALSGIMAELQAMHSQHARVAARVRNLEGLA